MLLSLNLTKSPLVNNMETTPVVNIEEELVSGLLKGDRKTQERFYRHFFPIMYPTALRYGSSTEDAQEIINTAFLKAINGIKKYKSQNFGGWVRTIVKRTAIDYCRKFNYNKPQTFELIDIDEVEYNSALSNLEVKDIINLFSHLPNATRMVFNLFVFEELTHAEISEKLNISAGTSKWHVSNARKLLMDLIKSL